MSLKESSLPPDSEAVASCDQAPVADLPTAAAPVAGIAAPISDSDAQIAGKTAILAANDTPAASNQSPVTSHQSPASNSRQTPAETPDLSKVPVQSRFPLPDFTVADGLEITLWAENPLLAKPTQCNWDAQGRLWVASSALYPQIAPGQPADDKIIILEDTDGDGKAEKSTVFVDGLLIPTGVAPDLRFKNSDLRFEKNPAPPDAAKDQREAPGSKILNPKSEILNACYVGQSTELLYFEDTDGDGKADKKRIVFGGFGTEDTHHIVHTLRWGPDGRLYFNQSIYIHTHMETPWGMVRLNSGGVFAYDPRTERVEVFCRGLWNTWGHAWDQWGQSFLTDGAGRDGISWAFPGATFNPSEGTRRQMPSITPGNYPKFCGLELIYSPHFPESWQGTAVTCDFRAHKIVHFKINDLGEEDKTAKQLSSEAGDGTAKQQSGEGKQKNSADASSSLLRSFAVKSAYTTEQLPVLVQTSDATFRPIDVKLGPDGALYIADWSNPIINHGEVDFRDPRRDKTHGRIWRLGVKGGKKVKWESLVEKKPGDLIKSLTSGNAWERANAQRALIHAAGAQKEEMWGEDIAEDKTGVRPALVGALAGGNSETIAAVWGVARAINFDYFHAGPEGRMFQAAAIETAAQDSRWRALATRRAGEWLHQSAYTFESDDEAVGATSVLSDDILPELARDKSPRVRVEAMRALARIPNLEGASLILDAAINAPADDVFYDFAAWRSINDLAEVWTKAVLAGEWKPEGREKQLEFALNALDAAQAGPVLAFLLRDRPLARNGAGPWIELIGKGGGRGEVQMLAARVAAGEFDQAALVRAMNALADAARIRDLRPDAPSARVAELIDSPDAATRTAAARLAGLWRLADAAPRLESLAAAPAADLRAAAFDGLRSLGGPAVPVLQRLVKSPNAAVPPLALAALAQVRPDAAVAEIPAVFGAMKSEQEMMQTWRAVLQSGGAMNQLAKKFPVDVPKPVLVTALRAARELGRKGQPLANKLAPLAGEIATTGGTADYANLAMRAKADGDPVAGEALYRRTASACVTCHAIGGAGGKLGPDMTSIGASAPPDYIIESILDPAAKVKEGYHAFTFTMKDGTEAIGIPARETAQEQFIRTVAGEQPLSKANITGRKLADGGASLMPAGLVNAWSDRERLNLYAFLAELGRPGPFDASKNNVARVWQLADTGKVEGALKTVAADVNPRADQPAGDQPALSQARLPEGAAAITFPVYTLVDGRLTKDLLVEKLTMLQPKNDTVQLAARFQAASAGKAKFNLLGIRKAWLDGQPLAIASEPSPNIDLAAGAHTLTIEVETKTPPEVIRVESAAVSFLGD